MAEASGKDEAHEKWERECIAYHDQRKSLVDAYRSMEEGYDRWLLTLAGGAIGVSMAFLKDLVKPAQAVAKHSLFGAWICLSVSIVLILANMRLSPWAIEKRLHVIDDEFHHYYRDDNVWERIKKKNGCGALNYVIGIFNWASLALFLYGMYSLAHFTMQNIR